MTTIDISAATTRYAKLNADYEAYLEKAGSELRDEIRKTLGEIMKIFFEANPQVASISWTQYTPYFNDGDACEFDVGERRFTIRDGSEGIAISEEDDAEMDDDEDDEEEHGLFRDDSSLLSSRAFYSKGGYKDPAKVEKIEALLAIVGGDEGFAKISRDFEVVSGFIGSIDDGHLEDMFDDHVQVCCTPTSITVYKYHEHD